MAGVVQVIDKEKRRGSDHCAARHGNVGGQWVAQLARPITNFSSTEHSEERKITLKMKPHRVRNPFKWQLVKASK